MCTGEPVVPGSALVARRVHVELLAGLLTHWLEIITYTLYATCLAIRTSR